MNCLAGLQASLLKDGEIFYVHDVVLFLDITPDHQTSLTQRVLDFFSEMTSFTCNSLRNSPFRGFQARKILFK